MKAKLWTRELSCRHQRDTSLAFMMGNYEKPKVGDGCYCRVCFENVKVVGVKESYDKEEKEFLKWVGGGLRKK